MREVVKFPVLVSGKERLIAMDDRLEESAGMRSVGKKGYAGHRVCPSRVSKGFMARVGDIASVPAASGQRHRWSTDLNRQTIDYTRSESHGPNQSLEPTTTAVMISAAQKVTPAVVVAHL